MDEEDDYSISSAWTDWEETDSLLSHHNNIDTLVTFRNLRFEYVLLVFTDRHCSHCLRC